MLAQDNNRQSAWHVAVKWSNVMVLDKLSAWAKQFLNGDELNNKLLLAKDDKK